MQLYDRHDCAEAMQSLLQCVQAKQTFGWEPKVALRDGLAHMVADFSERLSVTNPKAEALEDNVLAKNH